MGKMVVAVLVGLLYAIPVEAGDVYYEPTPFRLKKSNGSAMPQDLKIVHTWSGWMGNVYNTTLVQDDTLTIGGWGDTYASLLRFDLTGLPKQVTQAQLWLFSLPSGYSNQSQMSMFPITAEWNPASTTWANQPPASQGIAWAGTINLNTWNGFNITTWYNEWKSGARPDKGVYLWPYNNDPTGAVGRFSTFDSPRSRTEHQRPQLHLVYNDPPGMPPFKMPLPGGASWLVTNEIGGYECMGTEPFSDTAHQGNSYFSIDISPTNYKDNGTSSYTGDIKVIAAAGGTVAFIGTDPNHPNGIHFIINHSGGTSQTSGWMTKSIHLQEISRKSNGQPWVVGDTVTRGDQVGIMGNTGMYQGQPTSNGRHLHWGIYYNGSGASTVPELTYATVDGLLMKSYQTECDVNASGVPVIRTRYYRSTNRLY